MKTISRQDDEVYVPWSLRGAVVAAVWLVLFGLALLALAIVTRPQPAPPPTSHWLEFVAAALGPEARTAGRLGEVVAGAGSGAARGHRVP